MRKYYLLFTKGQKLRAASFTPAVGVGTSATGEITQPQQGSNLELARLLLSGMIEHTRIREDQTLKELKGFVAHSKELAFKRVLDIVVE